MKHKRKNQNPSNYEVIVIQDWAGNILFEGLYTDKEVDQVLDANRCTFCKDGVPSFMVTKGSICWECDDTGYKGEFEVYWTDEKREDNVYEFINY